MKKLMQHSRQTGAPAAEHYEATSALGAPFRVLLSGGFTKKTDQDTGKELISIEDLSGLIAAVVQTRVLYKRKLNGPDLKFIRSVLCMKSNEVAKVLDLSAEHYSRCEAGGKVLSGASEKAFRMIAFLAVTHRNRELRNLATHDKATTEIERNPEDSKKAMDAFQKIFLDMDINPIHVADDDFVLTFNRTCTTEHAPSEGRDEEWGSTLQVKRCA